MYISLIKNQIIPSTIYKFGERGILLFRRLCEVSIDDRILIETFNYKYKTKLVSTNIEAWNRMTLHKFQFLLHHTSNRQADGTSRKLELLYY